MVIDNSNPVLLSPDRRRVSPTLYNVRRMSAKGLKVSPRQLTL